MAEKGGIVRFHLHRASDYHCKAWSHLLPSPCLGHPCSSAEAHSAAQQAGACSWSSWEPSQWRIQTSHTDLFLHATPDTSTSDRRSMGTLWEWELGSSPYYTGFKRPQRHSLREKRFWMALCILAQSIWGLEQTIRSQEFRSLLLSQKGH